MNLPLAVPTTLPRHGLLAKGWGLASELPERLHGGLGYHLGPAIVNQLGYQVFRAVYKNVGWHLRRPEIGDDVAPFVAALNRDGCIAIPDFLPADEFAKLRAEYEKSRAELPYEVHVVEDNGTQEAMLDLTSCHDALPNVWALVNNARLRRIVSGALRRPISARPRLWLKYWQKLESYAPKGPGHIIGGNYIHADMHYPTFKAFLYLNDVDERNGAFEFALGSHKMTLGRVAYEYDASVRVARSRERGEYGTGTYSLIRKPTAAQARRLGGLLPTPMCGRANTLVLANTEGFHRQGDFQPGTLREAAYMCFRSSEPGGAALVAGR
jgi:phytanoyl-CoA dioxygenase PhyH